MQPEKISLYFKDATSDKEYHVQLTQVGEGFCVTAQNGPRGGTMSHARKAAAPVEYAVAKKDYDALVKSKTKRGYSTGTAGTAFVGGDLEARFTGITPQLLNPIDAGEEGRYLSDPNWVLEEKYDGHRRLVQVSACEVVGINRKGLVAGLPQSVLDAVTVLQADPAFGDAVLDGELMGEVFALFDVLEIGGKDIRAWPLHKRLEVRDRLKAQLEKAGTPGMFGVYAARTEAEKRKLFAALVDAHAEGGVFKELYAEYVPGRPTKGGTQLKRKFTHRATLVVDKLHVTKRSVHVVGFGANGERVALGKCTIPPNKAMPTVDDLVEIEYLYAFKGGSLFQPQYQGPRDDIERADCTLMQLHYKADGADAEDTAEETQAA